MGLSKNLVVLSALFTLGAAFKYEATPDPFCPYPSNVVTFYPFPTNCSRYIECYAGTKYIMDCPAGLFWNQNIETCDYVCNDTSPVTTSKAFEVEFLNVATPDPICPYPSDEITFFPYPPDCTKYIECFSGTKYIMDCPSGLFWNQYTTTCDYVCNGTGPVTTSNPNPGNGCPATGSALLPNYADCTHFYRCTDGVKAEEVCPSGYAFSITVQACEIKSSVDCSYTTLQPTTTTSKPNPGNGCPAIGNALLPDYSDCSKFYQCIDGVKYAEVCPAGYAFSIVVQACQIASTVDCSYTTENPHPTTKNPNRRCPTNGLSYLPDYGDCTQYYQCFMGDETLMKCDAGLAWSIVISACDQIEYVDCSYTTIHPPTANPNPNECPATGTSFLPHPYDCSLFYECINGVKHLLQCPSGYRWSITLDSCELEAYVDCGYTSRNPNATTPIPTKPTNPPTKAPTNTPFPENTCNGMPNGAMFPHPTDCKKYIECDNGKEVVMDCAPGTTFDPNLSVCDNNDAENCAGYSVSWK